MGAVSVREDTLRFEVDPLPNAEVSSAAREAREWPVDSILSVHRVAGAIHVEIGLEEEGEAPALMLHVGGEDADVTGAFEAELDNARSRYSSSIGVGASAWARRASWRRWFALAVIVTPLMWLLYTVLVPHAHVLISQADERALGDAVFESFGAEWSVIEDPELDAFLARVVAELGDPEAGFDLRVTVVDEDEPNAFALPGGQMVVFAGLLDECESADVLAGVMAHEIVHVEQRHGLKHLLRTLGMIYFAGCFVGGGVEEFTTVEAVAEMSSLLFVFKHSRAQEEEADRLGVAKLRAANRPAGALASFFERMDSPGRDRLERRLAWMSTHPTTRERIAALRELAGEDPPGVEPWLEPAVWAGILARVR